MIVLKGILLGLGIVLLCFNIVVLRAYSENRDNILPMIRSKITDELNERPDDKNIKELDEMSDEKLQKMINIAAGLIFTTSFLIALGLIIGAIFVR